MVVLALNGCAESEAEQRANAEKAATVRVSKADPPAECSEIGPVEQKALRPNYERIYEAFKLRVADRGGNYARLDSIGYAGDFTAVRGLAYRCPAAAVTLAAPAAPVDAALVRVAKEEPPAACAELGPLEESGFGAS
jgi:hypothetical protein